MCHWIRAIAPWLALAGACVLAYLGYRIVAIVVIVVTLIVDTLARWASGDVVGSSSPDTREEVRRIPVQEVKEYRITHPEVSIMEAYSRLDHAKSERTHDVDSPMSA